MPCHIYELLGTYKKAKLVEQVCTDIHKLGDSSVAFDNGESYPAKIICSDEQGEYLFISIDSLEDDLSQINKEYYALFKRENDGTLYEIEREGENREALNRLVPFFKDNDYKCRILVDDEVLVFAYNFYMKDAKWNTIVYELNKVGDLGNNFTRDSFLKF